MKLEAKVNFDRFEEALQVVDAHTAGEFCRMVIGGFPEPEGNTMIEKKKWMEEKYDHVRTALMLEPRGHHDMFGAFLCEPIHEEADLGVIFMDTGGYLNMCGHCTIGAMFAGFPSVARHAATIPHTTPASTSFFFESDKFICVSSYTLIFLHFPITICLAYFFMTPCHISHILRFFCQFADRPYSRIHFFLRVVM